jgi:hypothetical protein
MSGQSCKPLVNDPCAVSLQWSLVELKSGISRFLGGTPSPNALVLARAERQTLVELCERDIPHLIVHQKLFVFTLTIWNARNVVRGPLSSFEERRKALLDVFFVESELEQLKRVRELSLKSSGSDATRRLLAERASLFEFKENRLIDREGDCQFDAAADQLVRTGRQEFALETKESVRVRAVQWIRDHADHDLGHGVTVRQWIEGLPEYGSFEVYLHKMGTAKFWGDEVTLLVIRHAYQVCISIIGSIAGEYNCMKLCIHLERVLRMNFHSFGWAMSLKCTTGRSLK